MKLVIVAALLSIFHRAGDGAPVHIAPAMVTEITTPFGGYCPDLPTARTFIRTLASTYCVRESLDEVNAAMESASREDKLLSPERDRPPATPPK